MVNLNEHGGSMGIPSHMAEAMQKKKQEQKKVREESLGVDPEDEVAPKLKPEPQAKPEKEEAKKPEEIGAKAILKRLGIELTEEDINQIIFKGSVTKKVEVIKGMLVVEMKTLTTEEYDTVDEILTEEAKDTPMSNDGYMARKSVLTTTLGVIKMDNKKLVSNLPMREGGIEVDLHALSAARRKVLSKLSGQVMDKIIECHGAFTMAVNMVLQDPGEHLKNS